jgi:hypothetical protein
VGVVEEEDPFDRNQGSQENGMGNWGRLKGSRQMVEVDANEEPLYESEHRQRRLEERLTRPPRIGKAASTIPMKTKVTMTGGL